jgi:SWIM zinc finger
MQAVREITVWEGDIQPNHQYLLDGDKMVAYIAMGSTEPKYFKEPIRIDKRGRKFVAVTPNPFKKVIKDTRVAVEGSKGAVYMVDIHEKTCTCSGFQFRGKCKHIQLAIDKSKAQ